MSDERAKVITSLLELDCFPVVMEHFPASGLQPKDFIKQKLDECDYYILILAGRYGSLDPCGISMTEMEYDYARKKGLQTLCFVKKDISELPIRKRETTDDGRNKLNQFRDRVYKDATIVHFDNADDLAAHVVSSLHNCMKQHPAIGYTRAGKHGEVSEYNLKLLERYLDEHNKLSDGECHSRVKSIPNEAGENTLYIY